MNPDAKVSFDRQYQALRDECGLVELADWSSVTLTGRDRHAFLHNFCTNDVKFLTPGTGCEAFFTNVKGKIIGHGLVTCRADELVIVGAPGQGEALAAHLDRYVIREDVAVRDTAVERCYLLLAGGDKARESAESVGVFQTAADRPDQPGHWIEWPLLNTDFCGLVEIAGDAAPVRETLVERGAVLCDQAAFEALRIESGMPLYGTDFDDSNLPQEVGRNDEAISFTKGCYLGQETVARIDALGHVNQQLVGVRFEGHSVPEFGAELSAAGKSVGRITSATMSPQLGRPLALAMVRRPHNETGSRLESPVGPCEVLALPVS